MTTFDKRKDDAEARYELDKELEFKVTARRNKLFGLWAAEQMGITGSDADASAYSQFRAYRHPRADLQANCNSRAKTNGHRNASTDSHASTDSYSYPNPNPITDCCNTNPSIVAIKLL